VSTQAAGRSAEEVSAALERALARRERDEPTMLEELVTWLSERFGFEPIEQAGDVILWLFVILFAVLLLWILRRVLARDWSGAGRGVDFDDEEVRGPSIAERVALLRREAAEARARGEMRLALQKLLFALVLGLGGRGDLEFHDAWTYRELLRRGNPSPDAGAILGPLVGELEAKDYGREPVGPDDLERLESLCTRYLGGAA